MMYNGLFSQSFFENWTPWDEQTCLKDPAPHLWPCLWMKSTSTKPHSSHFACWIIWNINLRGRPVVVLQWEVLKQEWFVDWVTEVCECWGLSKPRILRSTRGSPEQTFSKASVWNTDITRLHWFNYPQLYILKVDFLPQNDKVKQTI